MRFSVCKLNFNGSLGRSSSTLTVHAGYFRQFNAVIRPWTHNHKRTSRPSSASFTRGNGANCRYALGIPEVFSRTCQSSRGGSLTCQRYAAMWSALLPVSSGCVGCYLSRQRRSALSQRTREYPMGFPMEDPFGGVDKPTNIPGNEELHEALRMLPKDHTLQKLIRYGNSLLRQLDHAIAGLERAQRQRAGEQVPPPLTIDVDAGGLSSAKRSPGGSRAELVAWYPHGTLVVRSSYAVPSCFLDPDWPRLAPPRRHQRAVPSPGGTAKVATDVVGTERVPGVTAQEAPAGN